MAVQERKAETTLDRYIAEVRSVWGDGKDPQLPFKVKAAMEKLFASTSADDPWMAELIRQGKSGHALKGVLLGLGALERVVSGLQLGTQVGVNKEPAGLFRVVQINAEERAV